MCWTCTMSGRPPELYPPSDPLQKRVTTEPSWYNAAVLELMAEVRRRILDIRHDREGKHTFCLKRQVMPSRTPNEGILEILPLSDLGFLAHRRHPEWPAFGWSTPGERPILVVLHCNTYLGCVSLVRIPCRLSLCECVVCWSPSNWMVDVWAAVHSPGVARHEFPHFLFL